MREGTAGRVALWRALNRQPLFGNGPPKGETAHSFHRAQEVDGAKIANAASLGEVAPISVRQTEVVLRFENRDAVEARLKPVLAAGTSWSLREHRAARDFTGSRDEALSMFPPKHAEI
jgi:hypothetical protein